MFAAVTFVFLAPALLGQRTYGALDQLEAGAPYRDAIGRPPKIASPIQTDQAEALSSPAAFYRELRHGRWLTWEPDAAGGTPAGILPFNALLSPFTTTFLVTPAWYANGLRIALALFFGQVFTYLFLKRLGVARLPATLGAIAYVFCGTNIVFIGRVGAPMLLPALLWATQRLLDAPSRRRVALLALFVAWTWFEGFPAAFVYCMYTVVLWAIWLVWRTRSTRRPVRDLAIVAGALSLGALLSAISAVPFAVEVLARGALEQRPTSTLPGIQQFGLIEARALGAYPGTFWTGLNPVESVSHAGLAVMAAALAGLVAATLGRLRLREVGARAWSFFAGASALLLVVCFHRVPGLMTVVEHLPGVADNPVGRSRFVLNLGLVVLAVLALDAWSAPPTLRIAASRRASAVRARGRDRVVRRQRGPLRGRREGGERCTRDLRPRSRCRRW